MATIAAVRNMDVECAKSWHDYQHRMEGRCSRPELCPMAVLIAEIERLEKIIKEGRGNYD